MSTVRITRAALCLLVFLAAGTALFAQPRLADLTVVSTRVAGGRVTAVVANRGAVAPAIRTTATLFIHQDGQPMRSVNAVTPALLPRTTVELTFDGIVPAGAKYQVMVDSDRRLAESDEGNNRTNNETVAAGRPVRPRGVAIVPELAQQARGIVIAPLPDGEPRPVAVSRSPSGNTAMLIENELLLTTKNAAEAEALAARHGGKVVRRVDRPAATGRGSTYVIRVSTASAPPDAITPREDGFAFSTAGARNLLAIAAHERRKGTRATINVVTPGLGFFEKTTSEGGGNDGLSPDYMQTGGKYDVDVAGAWKALFQAGKTSSKPILIGIVDSGFNLFRPDFTELDVDVDSSFGVGPPGQVGCGPGNPCPWHGQNMAEAAAAIANDGRGWAGPGGPVSKIVAIDRGGGTIDSTIWAIFLANARGARIINLSFGGKFELDPDPFAGALVQWLADYNADTKWLHDDAGRLLFAGAGNSAEDIDAGTPFGEAFWHHPCENQGVICVGGWHMNASPPGAGMIPAQGLPGSNFSTGGGEVVDIWGPWCGKVGDDFANPGMLQSPLCGTSISTAFVSGVASLIWAANPALSNDQVWNLMNKHAIQGGPLVRRVHAFRAVREALMSTGINTAPAVQLTSSIKAGVLSQASPTTFSVIAYDVEDEKCCSTAWTINGQPAGTGPTLSHLFGPGALGMNTIAVTLTDTGGKTATAKVSATLSNKAPNVFITEAPASVLKDVIMNLKAQVMDDTNPVSLPDTTACENVQWTSSQATGIIATGCEPKISFPTAGSGTLTATYTDAFGAKDSDSRTVNVVAPPPSKLIASIVLPKSGSLFGSGEPIVPQEQALQVEGKLTKVWTLTSKSLDQTTLVVLKDVNGTQAFKLADAFPTLSESAHTEQYTLHLVLMTSSGQAFTESVDIQQLANVH